MTVSYEDELRYKELIGWYVYFPFILCSTVQIEVKFKKKYNSCLLLSPIFCLLILTTGTQTQDFKTF
jgi:hypothetical protein